MEAELLSLFGPMLEDDEAQLGEQDEAQVSEIESEIGLIIDQLKDVEEDYGAHPTEGEWNADAPSSKIKSCLYHLVGIFHKASALFHEDYCKAFNPKSRTALRLIHIRKFFLSHEETLAMVVTVALMEGMDVMLSCIALKLLQLLWSSMLDPDYPVVTDPLGLGLLRVTFDEVTGYDFDRVVKLAANPEALSGAHAVQRALATSLLRHCVRDVENCYKFVEHKDGYLKILLRRLIAYHPRERPRSPRKKSSPRKRKPPAQLSAASTASPPTAPADRIVVPLRRGRPGGSGTPGTPAIGSAVASPTAFPTSPRRTAEKRQREDEDPREVAVVQGSAGSGPVVNPVVAGSASSGPPPRLRRRGLASRIRRVTEVVQDDTLFPIGCHPAAPPPQSLQELDTLGVLHVMSGVATCQETLAPALQYDMVGVLMHLLHPSHRAVRSHDTVIAGYNVIAALLTYKRIAFQFLEADGLEQIVDDAMLSTDAGNSAVVQGQCCALLQFTKITSALERFACTKKHIIPKLVLLLVTLLKGKHSVVHRREAGLLLYECFSIPTLLEGFDSHQDSLSVLVNALDESSKQSDCSSGVEASLTLALTAYIKSHLFLSTSVLWPASQNFGKGVYRSSPHKVLPNKASVILTFLELPLSVIQQRQSGPDKKVAHIRAPGSSTGGTLLTRSRLTFIDNLEKCGVIPVLLRILRIALRWTATQTLEPVLFLLEVLSSIPFLHSIIARCDLGENPVTCGLALLLEVSNESWDDFQKGEAPRHVNVSALTCIRKLVTPAQFDEQSRQDYDEIWQLFRINSGVRTVLDCFLEGSSAPPALVDHSRSEAVRILLAMTPHPTLRGMLAKLGVPKLLLGILHGHTELHNADSTNPIDRPTAVFYNIFKQAATLVVTLVTSGKSPGHEQSMWELPTMDSALKRLEKSVIVQGTDVEFSDRELLEIIQVYLKGQGLERAAEVLKKEARLGGVSAPQRPLHDLSDIVKGFLKKQHMDCKNPVSTLPAFSLCRGTQPALRAATTEKRAPHSNVALRVRERMWNHNTRSHARYDRRLVYTHMKSNVLRRGHSHAQIISLQFDREGTGVFLGLNSGTIVYCKTQNVVEKDAQDYQVREEPEPVTGMRLSRLHEKCVIWSEAMLSLHTVGGDAGVSDALFSLEGRSGVFGNYNRDLLTVTSVGESKSSLYNLETNATVATFYDQDRTLENEFNLACTDPQDHLLLSDSVLYDIRQSTQSPIYSYDKFTHNSRGIFAPSMNEVIIDKDVCKKAKKKKKAAEIAHNRGNYGAPTIYQKTKNKIKKKHNTGVGHPYTQTDPRHSRPLSVPHEPQLGRERHLRYVLFLLPPPPSLNNLSQGTSHATQTATR